MKRSKYVHLSLAAAVSVAIAGCEPSQSTVKRATFQSVAECSKAQIPVEVCSNAYMAALKEHQRLAPTYATKADCEADFVEGYCEANHDQQFMPRLGGFQISASGFVSSSQEAKATAQAGAASTGSSGGSNNGLLTGLLIGNMLSNNSGSYHSEPVYRYRDSRGAYETSTLNRRIESYPTSSTSGAPFSKARPINNQPYSSTISQQARAVNVDVVSRGGFGNQAAAKSGWGGTSRSFGG